MRKLFMLSFLLLFISYAYAEGDILFATYHINHAWGFTFYGITIDSQGNIFRFEYSSDDPCPEFIEGEVSAEYLRNLFDPGKTHIGSVSISEIQKMVNLIPATYKAPMSEPSVFSNDRGTYIRCAYLEIEETGYYKQIILSEDGDGGDIRNFSPEADEILAWMNTLARFQDIDL